MSTSDSGTENSVPANGVILDSAEDSVPLMSREEVLRERRAKRTRSMAGAPSKSELELRKGFRLAMLSAVQIEDIQTIMLSLIEKATNGDVRAGIEVLNRAVGVVESSELVQRLNELEERLVAAQSRKQRF